ncbi:MAG TPA: 3-oxoacyl-ACP reductase FabG [Candidatus Sumerlaeota bacterium]|nr:3-oxoacyl-ACP reductase FabG [Candidatus Sumerlaeota bacterium]HOR28728.1 3-oxoacyl-ACP reductase FabG [Candidatus Sumerlaeota bacterium]HPK02296.1 3-oxoacyl-ACP reductase FabG [Candidatus Sumerlaeota bacterium]
MGETLKGQVAVVTGGARGIGRAIAEALAAEGATLVLADLNADGAVAAAGEVARDFAVAAQGLGCDVSRSDACQALIDQAVQTHGRLDILVNNAGITRDKLLPRMTDEDWQLVLSVNLNSAFYCSKAAARVMTRARSGRIISIASVVGLMGNAGQCNYSASKAGLIGFSKSLAREIGGRGVTVNCVAPGFIDTAMTQVLGDDIKEALLKQIPLGKLGTPQDVAAAVVFLASPAAAYITGEVIRVDGGMAM